MLRCAFPARPASGLSSGFLQRHSLVTVARTVPDFHRLPLTAAPNLAVSRSGGRFWPGSDRRRAEDAPYSPRTGGRRMTDEELVERLWQFYGDNPMPELQLIDVVRSATGTDGVTARERIQS